MTTKKQIRANRENAKKSTGPKSKAGKKRSSRNAIKHGLFTDVLLLPEEDSEALTVLKNGLHADFRPVTHMQAVLIDRLAMLIWRERRLARAEASEIQAQNSIAMIERGVSTVNAERVLRNSAHARAGTLDVARQLLIGRYQTMLTNQVERTLNQYYALVEREDMFAPCEPIATPANDSPVTIETKIELEDGVELLEAFASSIQAIAKHNT